MSGLCALALKSPHSSDEDRWEPEHFLRSAVLWKLKEVHCWGGTKEIIFK
jgi:hypothetical protein